MNLLIIWLEVVSQMIDPQQTLFEWQEEE